MAEWVKKWKVTKASTGKEYIVSVADDGTWGCGCPVWTFKRQICKHINLVNRGVLDSGRMAGYEVELIYTKEGWAGKVMTKLNPKAAGATQVSADTLQPIEPITLADQAEPIDVGEVTVAAKTSRTTFGEAPKHSIPIKTGKASKPNPPTVLEVLKANAIYGGVL